MKRTPYQVNKGLRCSEKGCPVEAACKGLCKKHWQARYMSAYRTANLARNKARKREKKYHLSPKGRATQAAWYTKNRVVLVERQRERTYLKLHGSTLADYDRLYLSQRGRCAICRVKSTGKRGLYFDHCHKARRPRGLLCRTCNIAVGYAEKDPIRVRRVAAYLSQYSSSSTEA